MTVGSEVVMRVSTFNLLRVIRRLASGEARTVMSKNGCQYLIKLRKMRSPPLRLLPKLV